VTAGVRDVVVVGAGLAGCALAARLARSGMDVLLLERGRFPRDKLCGEFLSPEAVPSLRALGLGEALREAAPAVVRSFRLTAPGGHELVRPLEVPGLGVTRRRLDELVARAATAAGAELRQGCRAVDVRRADDGFVVEALEGDVRRAWRARAAVLATGRLSRLAGGTRRREERARWVAWKRHHAGSSAVAGAVEIHAFPGGYCGLNMVEGGVVNACLIARTTALDRADGDLDELVARAGAASAALGERLAGLQPVGPPLAAAGGRMPGRSLRPGAVLEVGDAAGMIAPVCGDGMAMALRSAEIAAPVLHDAVAGRLTWEAALARHHAARSRELGRRLALGRMVHEALLHGATARALIAAGRTFPGAADWMIRSTRDRTPATVRVAPPETCR
jgi:flavin-dependent dehydrogenase